MCQVETRSDRVDIQTRKKILHWRHFFFQCETYWLPLMDLWSDIQSIRYYIHVLVANSMRCVLTRDIQQKDIVNICIDLTNVFGAQWNPRKRVEGILQLTDHEFIGFHNGHGLGWMWPIVPDNALVEWSGIQSIAIPAGVAYELIFSGFNKKKILIIKNVLRLYGFQYKKRCPSAIQRLNASIHHRELIVDI